MPVEIKTEPNTNFIEITASGKLTVEDYHHFVPEIEKIIDEHGKVTMLFVMKDFHGWKMGAVWEDTKFGFRHFTQVSRVGLVGDKAWEKGMAIVCKPFTLAKVKYFDIDKEEDARAWVMEKVTHEEHQET